jgi:hypothetical protein
MRRAAALALVVLLVAACGGTTGTPAPSGGGCTADVKAPGTFPDLEALLPLGMIERSPDTVDSGLNCTPASLGTYVSHGLAELRFAGATWDYGNGNATVVAVLGRMAIDAASLDVAWVEEFYTAGALAAKHTEDIKTSRPTMAGAGQVFRLEALNDLSLQTVVIWSAAPYVRVVIVATTVNPDASRAEHDQRVATAVEVAAAVPIR